MICPAKLIAVKIKINTKSDRWIVVTIDGRSVPWFYWTVNYLHSTVAFYHVAHSVLSEIFLLYDSIINAIHIITYNLEMLDQSLCSHLRL